MREARSRYASCANPVQMAAMEMTPLDKTTTRMSAAAAEEVSGRSSERRTGSDVVLSVATAWRELAARPSAGRCYCCGGGVCFIVVVVDVTATL